MDLFVLGLVQYMFHRRFDHNSLFDWVCEVHVNRYDILFQELLGESQRTHSHSHQMHGEEFYVEI